MNILQTPVRFYPHIGGVETYVHSLSKNLTELGHDVHVICAKVEQEIDRHEIVDGINVTRLTSVGSIANTNLTPDLPKALYEQAKWADVIHTHLPTPWSADISALAGVVTDTPVVVTYHNDIVGEGMASYIAELYNKTVLPVTLRLADSIIVTSPEYVDQSLYLNTYENKISVIPNGVDVDEFRPMELPDSERSRLGFDSDRPNLFFLSVLDEHHDYKGLDVLLEAIAILDQDSDDPPKLLVGGEGPVRSKYETLASELDINSSVSFLGRVPEDDLVKLYSGADAFVLPSTSSDQEGFGLVLLEALASGTPVITTDVVGVADDVVEHNIGRLVSKEDPKSLSQIILESVSDVSFDRDCGRRLCEKEYSWRASAESMVDLYASIVR